MSTMGEAMPPERESAMAEGTKDDPWVLKTRRGLLPPLLEELGLAELTHDARNNRMRATS
jgi:hypothetical protein